MRKMQFNRTYRRFKWRKIQVFDVEGSYVENDWVEDLPGTERTIEAIPFLDSPLEVQVYSEGSSSAATMKIITKSMLYWTDINAEAQLTRQSYVVWKGYNWRVMGSNEMLGNVSELQIYSLERYVR